MDDSPYSRTMADGAAVLVGTCAAVRSGEQVVIVTDDERLHIAGALRSAAEDAGTSVTMVVTPVASMDNREPSPPVTAAMARADVLFLAVTMALAHTRATREAIARGARVVSMSAFTERLMREGGLFTDFHARKPFCDHLAERLTRARSVRIVNAAGTDLSLAIEGRVGNSHACIVRDAGFTAVPNIEANVSPLEGQGEGTLVVDGSIPYYGVGVIRDPVRMEIGRGAVRTISGGEQAAFLAELLDRQRDPNVYNVAQFSFGLNLDCTDFTGEMLNDEGVNGTIHIGIGTSANLGGSVQAKTHFDAIIREPSVWLDGELVLERGAFVLPQPPTGPGSVPGIDRPA